MPEEEEVQEGDKWDGDRDHPGLDVDVRGLLSRVLVPVEPFAQTYSTSDCVCWVVLHVHVITLRRFAELDINHNLVEHDGARPHDEEGDGHTGWDDNSVAKSVNASRQCPLKLDVTLCENTRQPECDERVRILAEFAMFLLKDQG